VGGGRAGGEGGIILGMDELWSYGMHTGMAHRLSALKGGEGVIAPRFCDRLWAVDSGGWSSAIAPSCPYLAVRSSGIGASCDSYFRNPLIPLRSSQTERRLVAFVWLVWANVISS